MKRFLKSFLVVMVVSLFFASSLSYAKPTSEPKGWHKGKKEGWHGQSTPPGLSKKEMKGKEKQTNKEARKAEKETRKKTWEAKKAAKAEAQETGEQAKQAVS